MWQLMCDKLVMLSTGYKIDALFNDQSFGFLPNDILF